MTDDLIKRLRDYFNRAGGTIWAEASDAIEAQAKRIEELDADGHYWCQLASKWQARAETAEADLAAARDAIRDAAADDVPVWTVWKRRHAPAIAAARGEKPKPDVCPTCEGVVLGIGVCPACGTGKKETK